MHVLTQGRGAQVVQVAQRGVRGCESARGAHMRIVHDIHAVYRQPTLPAPVAAASKSRLHEQRRLVGGNAQESSSPELRLLEALRSTLVEDAVVEAAQLHLS